MKPITETLRAIEARRMKLFSVNVQYTLMVMAETDRQAEIVGEQCAGEDGSEADMSTAIEVTSLDQVPSEWVDSIPFGTKENRPCREILTK